MKWRPTWGENSPTYDSYDKLIWKLVKLMDEQLKAKVERLKATRTGNRSVVTRTINECDEILNNETLTEENVSRLEKY